MSVRKPAVAGLFYPDDEASLRAAVTGFLAAAGPGEGAPPKALIVPHAGFVYSAPVAAAAYARLAGAAPAIGRVVLLGPSHRVPFHGLALPGVEAFETPLGTVPLDPEAIASIEGLDQVIALPAAHEGEHSLEVHLPFLQTLLRSFTLVPLVVGDAAGDAVAEVLEALWGGPETLIVISSDLSHYHDYATARAMDAATSAAIEALAPERIGYEDACGRVPVSGLLEIARRRGLQARTVDLRNSGDTAGPKDRVVGYGAYVVA